MDNVSGKVDNADDVLKDIRNNLNTPPTVSLRQQNKPVSKPVEKKNNTGTFIVMAIVVLGAIVVFEDDMRSFFPEEPTILEPADIQLYQFNDLVSNDSVNVEILVTNIGEKTAIDIEVYIRVRDHNGTIVYTEILPITALLLRGNETCSGTYTILIDDVEYLTHTVEISWETGRNTYSKKTILA
jgi:hypothetical protein